MHATHTNISSISRLPPTPFMHSIFTTNNESITKNPVRRKQPTKAAAKKPTSLKPMSSINPSQNLFQSVDLHVREEGINPLPHANPIQTFAWFSNKSHLQLPHWTQLSIKQFFTPPNLSLLGMARKWSLSSEMGRVKPSAFGGSSRCS